jgi:hypothetical protein
LVLRRAVRHDVVLADGFACVELRMIPSDYKTGQYKGGKHKTGKHKTGNHKTGNHKTGR